MLFWRGFLVILDGFLVAENVARVLELGKGSVLGNIVLGFVLGVDSDNSDDVLVFNPLSIRLVDNLELDILVLTLDDDVRDVDNDIIRRPRDTSLLVEDPFCGEGVVSCGFGSIYLDLIYKNKIK